MTIPPRLTEALADRYAFERELGAGGMATVYLARDLRHDRLVAVKVFRPELAATIGSERFLREIRIAAQLQHPHILPLLDSGDANGLLYYVMPYVEGQSLRERLAASGELPVPEAVRLLTEIVDALSYAHARGVVHRDIKPDNIMLSGRHALVMDFGVAKAVSEATGRNTLTTAGVALGTPAYMAPEQAAADPHLDHRVDIYAVGVMAYEILSGQPPFTGGTAQQVLAAHMTQAADPLSRHRPGLAPALEAAVMRCLAKRPADRWQSADELLAQLEPLATPSGGMTPTATRPVLAAARPAVRHAWAIGSAAVLLALVALVWRERVGHSQPRTLQPEDVQLTFTGNAGVPALSADGKRMAYASQRCDSAGQCLLDLNIQDVGGSQAATLLSGAPNLLEVSWTADGRYLFFLGTFQSRFGAYSISTLGGAPTYLGGLVGALIAGGDTALVARETPPDTVAWLRRVRTSDGLPYDSLRVRKAPGDLVLGLPTGDARWIVLLRGSVAAPGFRAIVLDRTGQARDSLVVTRTQSSNLASVGVVAGTSQWWMLSPNGLTRDSRDVVVYSIDGNGRLSRPDTVLRNLSIGWAGPIVQAGKFVYSEGLPHFSVGAITTTSDRILPVRSRTLASATAVGLSGSISPDGQTLLIARERTVDGRSVRQLSTMPFDSGPERPLGPPAPILDWDVGVGHLYTLVSESDSTEIIRMALPSGASARMSAFAAGGAPQVKALPGEGFLVLDGDGRQIRRGGVPGRPDSTFTLPDTSFRAEYLEPSPDGASIVLAGYGASLDSIRVARFSLRTGEMSTLAVFAAKFTDQPCWLPDGRILVPIGESATTTVLYDVPSGGGPSVRLGVLARDNESFRFSADGRRGVVRAGIRAFDVYVIRNFGAMLK